MDSNFYEFGQDGNKIKYPRVTHVIDDVLAKGDGYLRWVGNNGYEKAMAIGHDAAEKGTAFHKFVNEYLTKKPKPKVSDEYAYRISELKEFMKGKKLIKSEELIISSEKGFEYAGTYDLLVKGEDGTILVDIKTGKSVRQETALQLSAYNYIVNANKIGVLHLPQIGEGKFYFMEYRPDAWKSLFEVYKWKHGLVT